MELISPGLFQFPHLQKFEAATTGLFTTLQTIFRPNVINDTGKYYWVALIIGIIFIFVIWRIRSGNSFLSVLLFFLFLPILVVLLLPTLGAAKSGISIKNVSITERKTVGIYETATISSRDGKALLNWLNQNGFATPANFIPAIQAYAQEGWFFVASKIRLDLPLMESAKPQPLAFTFKTERPVYPLRLTGIGNNKCRIDLYVFGSEQAEIPHFKAERCAYPVYPSENEQTKFWRLDDLRIRHPLLRSLVNNAPVATKLTAELNSQQMEQDGYINWTPYHEKQTTLYTKQGAAQTAANFCFPIIVLALVILYGNVRSVAPGTNTFRTTCLIIILAALIAWPVVYFLLPKSEAFLTRRPIMWNKILHIEMPLRLLDEAGQIEHKTGKSFKFDLAWARQQLSEGSAFRNNLPAKEQTNFFTGQLWHEEDSPGNFTLRQSPAGIEYIWYDIDGGTNVINLSD